MTRLLNKTLRPFTVYALLVLVLSIPVYYFIVDAIWVNELDKHHRAVKAKVEQEMNALQLADTTLAQTLAVWSAINPGSSFQAAEPSYLRPDSTYTLIRYDAFQQEREQFRGLVTYIRVNGKTYRLLVETNMEETDETILAIAGVTGAFFLLLLLGFVVLNRKLSQRIWQPFYWTLGRLRTFNLEGDKSLSFDSTDVFEFEELNRELTRLIEKNISAYSRQKEFTENASHELQTPLAIIKTKLDLLLQNPDLTGEQYETVEAINRTLARAYRINKNLLLLARIENRQIFDSETIDLSALVTECMDVLTEHAEHKNLAIDTHIGTGITLPGNRVLVEVLVNNLLLNAIRHTAENGRLHVGLTRDGFTVANSGEQALDTDALFKRFVSASKETPGSGLGLAIVEQIARRYGWQVEYRFEQGQHIFAVRF